MRILILSENRHNTIGGIELYNRMLIKLFSKKGYAVDEFSFNINPEKKDVCEKEENCNFLNVPKKFKKLSLLEKRRSIKIDSRKVREIHKNYDIVINSTSNFKWPKNIYMDSRWIYVQHFNPDFYKQVYIAGAFLQPLIYFGMQLVGIKNPFKKFQNLVFFTKEDANLMRVKPEKNSEYIQLSKYGIAQINEFKQNISVESKTDYSYIGRIDNFQKRISKTIKIFSLQKRKILLYGENLKYKNNSEHYKFLGMINSDEIEKVFDKTKYLVLLSKYEGFAFTIVEALSHGVPIITSNNCCSSKWLSAKKGFLIKNDKIDFEQIERLTTEEYSELVENCFQFALDNLTTEMFELKWVNYIEKICKKQN